MIKQQHAPLRSVPWRDQLDPLHIKLISHVLAQILEVQSGLHRRVHTHDTYTWFVWYQPYRTVTLRLYTAHPPTKASNACEHKEPIRDCGDSTPAHLASTEEGGQQADEHAQGDVALAHALHHPRAHGHRLTHLRV